MSGFENIFIFIALLSVVLAVIDYTEDVFGFKGNVILFIATTTFSFFSGIFNVYIFFLIVLSFFGIVGIKRPE